MSFLLVKQSFQYVFALTYCAFSEVLAQETAHYLHLGVHHTAVSLDDIRCKYEQCKQETVALSLVRRVLVASAIVVECSGVTLCIYGINAVVKQSSYGYARQSAEWASGNPAENASNPFACCHVFQCL